MLQTYVIRLVLVQMISFFVINMKYSFKNDLWYSLKVYTPVKSVPIGMNYKKFNEKN